MRKSTRQAKTAAKAKLSGAIQSSDVQKNKKIVFDDDVSDADDSQHDGEENENLEEESNGNDIDGVQEDAGESDDDYVEEVTGSAARESTQKLRDAERKMAKDSTVPKKKRKKNVEAARPTEPDEGSDIDDEDEVDELLTDDFLAMVDSERADQLQKAKQDKKKRKLQEKKRLGKHTTFVVDNDYNMIDAPQKMSQNIEVVALGGVGTDTDDMVDDHSRQHLISATIGTAPSKAAVAFARGSLSSGTSMARGSSGKKRTSKKEETWKRSRKMNSLVARSRTGNAAALFVRKR
jgi:hypothetical protein